MKTNIRNLGVAALLGAAFSFTPLALAQETVTQTTTSSDGTITEFSPGESVVIHSEASADPVRYTYSKSTTIVDEAGNPVDVSVVKSGVPVQVFYDHDGDHMVARRIIVHHAVAAVPVAPAPVVIKKDTVTTTTTHGE